MGYDWVDFPHSEAYSIQAILEKTKRGSFKHKNVKIKGTRGSVATFFVAIFYGLGVVVCKYVPWHFPLTKRKFVKGNI